jgi:hypothetical protein
LQLFAFGCICIRLKLEACSLQLYSVFCFRLWPLSFRLYFVFACSLKRAACSCILYLLLAFSFRLSAVLTVFSSLYPDIYQFTTALTHYKNLFSTEFPDYSENWKLRYIFVDKHEYACCFGIPFNLYPSLVISI